MSDRALPGLLFQVTPRLVGDTVVVGMLAGFAVCPPWDYPAALLCERRQTSCHGETVAVSPQEVRKSCVITKSW